RIASLTATDTVRVKWIPDIPQSGYYNIFVQVPKIENSASRITFKIYDNGEPIDTTIFIQPLPALDWVYAGTANLTAHAQNYLEMTACGSDQTGKNVAADVVKFSALVRERHLAIDQNFINLGAVSQDDTIAWNLKIENRGYKNLTIYDCSSTNQFVSTIAKFPIELAGMNSISLPLQFYSRDTGTVTDTLFIQSTDPLAPNFSIPITAKVETFFIVIDNEDANNYKEFGNWFTSNAQAYGSSSRYGTLNQIPRASATFTTILNIGGEYEIFEIVPTTVNASNQAAYVLRVSNVVVDSIVIDQNVGSGAWVSLGRYDLPAGQKIEMKVIDTGKNTNPNSVLRADAIKFSLTSEGAAVADFSGGNLPNEFHLAQNFPNPFNAITTIHFAIPIEAKVRLSVLNLLGQEIEVLVDEHRMAGRYSMLWDVGSHASGIYFYQLKTCLELNKYLLAPSMALAYLSLMVHRQAREEVSLCPIGVFIIMRFGRAKSDSLLSRQIWSQICINIF
ncbi:MAG: T9SS type A sorting domain-containing protein, partial [bacterium]|nr:T9SS type A sorting domain-containing protein [bacterium]